MKKIACMVFGLILFVNVPITFAQLTPDYIQSQLNVKQGCTTTKLEANRFWTPIKIDILYDITSKTDLQVSSGDTHSHLGYEKPEPAPTDKQEHFIMTTNATDSFVITWSAHYETKPADKPRVVAIQYSSNNELFQSETDFQYDFDFCKVFIVTTTAPPHFPTRADIISKEDEAAFRAAVQLPDKIDQTNKTVAGNSTLNLLETGALIVLVIALYVVMRNDKRKDVGAIKVAKDVIKFFELAIQKLDVTVKFAQVQEIEMNNKLGESRKEIKSLLKLELEKMMMDFTLVINGILKTLPENVKKSFEEDKAKFELPKKEDKTTTANVTKIIEGADKIKEKIVDLGGKKKETLEDFEKKCLSMEKPELKKLYEERVLAYNKNPTVEGYDELKIMFKILVGYN